MHELGITQAIIELCAERAGSARVTRVAIEIGRLSGVASDAVRFCFDVCAEGTPLEGATLEVIDIPGSGQCRDCGRAVVAERWPVLCECGSPRVQLSAGEELRVREMEVALPA